MSPQNCNNDPGNSRFIADPCIQLGLPPQIASRRQIKIQRKTAQILARNSEKGQKNGRNGAAAGSIFPNVFEKLGPFISSSIGRGPGVGRGFEGPHCVLREIYGINGRHAGPPTYQKMVSSYFIFNSHDHPFRFVLNTKK